MSYPVCSPSGRKRLRCGLLAFATVTAMLLGGCSVWPKALTFATDPEPVAAPQAPMPAPAVCKDCADGVTTAPVATSRPVVAPVPLAPASAVAAPVVVAEPAKPTVPASAPAMAAAAPRAPAPQVAVSVQKVPASGLVHGYYVNAGLFAVSANGSNAYQKLENAGLPVFSDVVVSKKGHLTRVRVGPYATRAQADAAAKKIRTLHLDANVFRR